MNIFNKISEKIKASIIFIVCLFFFLSNSSFAQVISGKLIEAKPFQGNVVALVQVSIPAHYKIYKDSITFDIYSPEGVKKESVELALPIGMKIYDPNYDEEKEVYKDGFKFKVKVPIEHKWANSKKIFEFGITYLSCSDEMCFPPATIKLKTPEISITSNDIQSTSNQASSKSNVNVEKPEETQKDLDFTKSQNNTTESSKDRISDLLKSGNYIYAFIALFLLGILLSLSPCILPMIPITMALLGAQAKEGSRLKGFILSLFYVLGLATTYGLLGVIAAKSGGIVGAAFQKPLVIILISLFFFALALSMFGAFELQVPGFLRNKFQTKGKRKGLIGAFITGLIAGIIASPCVAPVLAGVLIWIATTGNIILGFFMLFVFACGIGVLFILVGTFAVALSSGAWMIEVKKVFGILLVFASLYYIKVPLSSTLYSFICGVTFILLGVYAIGTNFTKEKSSWYMTLKKGFGVICIVIGVYSLIVFLGKQDFLPKTEKESILIRNNQPLSLEKQWLHSYQDALDKAKDSNKPIFIDFYAEWCTSCKELDKEIFQSSEFEIEGRNFILTKIDIDKEKKLMKKFKLVGVPTIIILSSDGKEVYRHPGYTGLSDKEKLLQDMKNYR